MVFMAVHSYEMGRLVLFSVFLFIPVWSSEVFEAPPVSRILKDYDSGPPSGQTQVLVGMYLRNVEFVSSADMSYKVQLSVRQRWNDPRLRFGAPHTYLNVAPENIWTPDLFFRNELSSHAHDLMKINSLVRVYPNGAVHFSQRVTLLLSCPMDLHRFPFDRQVCNISIASWGSTDDKLNVTWSPDKPVQLGKSLSWSDFFLTGVETSSCEDQTLFGTYSCLQASFSLRRSPQHYIKSYYFPLSMFTLISVLSFFINSSPIRITLIMFNLMGATALIFAINASIPPTSYNKSIDFYNQISFISICSSLIVFVLVRGKFKRNGQYVKVAADDTNDIRHNYLDRLAAILNFSLFAGFHATYFMDILTE